MSILKFGSLSVLTISVANFMILSSTRFIDGLIVPSKDNWIYVVLFWVLCSLLITLMSFILISTDDKKYFMFFYGLLLPSLFLNLEININGNMIQITILDIVLLSLGFIYLHTKFKRDIANQIKQSPNSILHGVGIFSIILAIIISLNFYALNNQNQGSNNLFNQTRNYILETSSYYSKNTTRNMIGSIIGENVSIPTYIGDEINQINASEYLQTKVSDQVTDRVDTFLSKYEPYLIPFYTGLIFLTVVTLSPFIRYLSYIFSLILFFSLKKLKFIVEENDTIDVIRYRL